jgi:hypothetical protein
VVEVAERISLPRQLGGYPVVRQFPLATFNNPFYVRVPTEQDLIRNEIASIDQEIGRIYGIRKRIGFAKGALFVQKVLAQQGKTVDEVFVDYYSAKSMLGRELTRQSEAQFEGLTQGRSSELNRRRALLESQLQVRQP